ncbi:MAG: cellulose biosynthesis cyclic di-GMP-binding regulatory protein BcsB, partial [Ewingella sp.]|nr:cellulose biosynthesis cyclic di-GMP-binding regulatory protein BcsB [Ewingella sp.]
MKSLPHKSTASGFYRRVSQGVLLALGMLPLTQTSAEEAPSAANADASALPAAPSWMPPAPAASAVETATPLPDVPAPVETAPAPVEVTPAQVETAPASMVQPFANSISVADMGQKNGLTLSGGQLQSGIIFTLPTDQVITNAKLSLALKISPALIARNTTLELMLNGQPLGSLPLSEESSAGDLFELDIPSAMVVSRNNLSFRVHDNNTMACEKDQSDKYWVQVLPTSHINLEGQQLNIGRDLGKFPRPFFDALQMQESIVPMAFTSSLQPQDVSAAAMVASYLGVLSDYRGVDFPVVLNDLPQQSGIVFGKPGDKIGSLTLPASQGPRIQLIDNPNNPVYKLLLITGNDENQLRQAAYRLISAPLPANTEYLDVTQQTIPARQPYDAPHWIDTTRPVTLGELVARDQNPLTATGIYHNEIHVPFRAAPDLFMWDGHTIPVKIDYRFPTENWIDEDNSQLNVSINGTFLRNLTVNKVGLLENVWRRIGFDSRQESYNLQLQPYLIHGDNQLAFYFDIQPKKDA